MRVGTGFDIHRLQSGRRLVLGGVEIPHSHGLLGHSDGDVLLHAVVDAMLGAAALGDIGEMFPDTDPDYKDMASSFFVEKALERLGEHGYKIMSVDSTVFAESPKISPHRELICQRMASMLSLRVEFVNVKGKTFEGLGPIGRGEAIAAQAVVLLASDT
jgi:2-C-methyl-D-erythritol 2,4-cyclodiphosphate synthase